MILLEQITIDDFSPCLNEEFLLHQQEPSVTLVKLRLTQVSAIGSPQSQAKRSAFSLVFTDISDLPLLEQKIYRLEHHQLGQMEIFLVPIARVTEGFQYEAVFN